jgi:hypothetical protein
VSESVVIRKQSKIVREQANHVREVARQFKRACAGSPLKNLGDAIGNAFPEISNDLEECFICKQPVLLRIHPDMFCYTCWLKSLRFLKDSIRDIQNGRSPEDAMRLLEQRMEEPAPLEV